MHSGRLLFGREVAGRPAGGGAAGEVGGNGGVQGQFHGDVGDRADEVAGEGGEIRPVDDEVDMRGPDAGFAGDVAGDVVEIEDAGDFGDVVIIMGIAEETEFQAGRHADAGGDGEEIMI